MQVIFLAAGAALVGASVGFSMRLEERRIRLRREAAWLRGELRRNAAAPDKAAAPAPASGGGEFFRAAIDLKTGVVGAGIAVD